MSFDGAKLGVEGLHVEKGDRVNTAIADAACLEGGLGNDYEEDNHDDSDDDDEQGDESKEQKATNAAEPRLNPQTKLRKNHFPSEDEEGEGEEEGKDDAIPMIIHSHSTAADTTTTNTIPTKKNKKMENPIRGRILVAGIGLEVWTLGVGHEG